MSLAEVVSSRAAGLPIALLAGLIVSLVIMRLGRGRFSPRLFGVALAVGALAAIPPMRIEGLFAPLESALSPFAAAALKAFCVAGLIEEAAKLALAIILSARTISRGHRETSCSASPPSRSALR